MKFLPIYFHLFGATQKNIQHPQQFNVIIPLQIQFTLTSCLLQIRMALFLSKSGKLLPHFKQKMCSLGMINISSWGGRFTQNPPLLPENGTNPRPVLDNNPALFASRRFGSVKADKLVSIDHGGDSQVCSLMLFYFYYRLISDSAISSCCWDYVLPMMT